MKTFGEILKEKREAIGWKQEELAEEVGISRNSISLYERGVAYPNILTAADLADVLDCTLDELVGRD